MAGEQADSLPPELREWVDERAADLEADRSDVLARAVTAYRHLAENGEDLVEAAAPEATEELAELTERLDELDGRVEDVESEFDDKIQDVRDRVVQVKREADGKAQADHSHPDIAESAQRAERLATEAAEHTDELESTLDDGFDNFEEVLTHLADTTDDLEGKVDTLASAVVDLRRRVSELESAASVDRAVAELRRDANQAGVRTAACEDCGTGVDIALLNEPVCPECRATFERVEPSRGFFGSAMLRVGSRPALTGETETVEDAADLFEETTAEADGGPESVDE